MKKIWLLNLVTFISAFLLFQIELIIAKMFLPNYGGSYLVWGSCIVFFQAALLLGYLYFHFVIRKFGIGRYRYAHLVLLLVPLLFFPGRPIVVGHPGDYFSLGLDVFFRLCVTIGPVFFVLATISLMTQAYLSQSTLPASDNPYALYAVSNFGSFAALLTYPFLFEFVIGLSEQLLIWRMLYFLLIALHGITFCVVPVRVREARTEEQPPGIKGEDMKRWLLLGAGGVVMFLSVNNIITVKIAPLPLLWILPLCIYLMAFVLNFKRSCWCPAWIREKIHIVLGLSALLYLLIQQGIFPVVIEIILLNAALFILCMYCQNRLIASKPHHEQDLTAFYVVIALGGFIGGVVTSWIIPLVSTDLIEYVAGLIMIAMTLVSKTEKARAGIYYFRLIVYLVIILTLWPVVFYKYNIWALILIGVIVTGVYSELVRRKHFVTVSLVCILCVIPYSEMFWRGERSIHKKRNYYGILRVVDSRGTRFLYHGTTLHGAQSLKKERASEATLYYDRLSPIAEIMTTDVFDFRRIGVVGLGVGMAAAYTTAGQVIDFYELDPDVYAIADRFFTFTDNAAGTVNYIYGDARLSLDKNVAGKYDLLIVDAFGGDAIPVHLLTKEMIALYKERLSDRGILMFHISNKYLELSPVLARIAYVLDANVCLKQGKNLTIPELVSTWLLMTWDDGHFEKLITDFRWDRFNRERIKKFRLWTDDYSTVLPVIKGKALAASVKDFKPFAW